MEAADQLEMEDAGALSGRRSAAARKASGGPMQATGEEIKNQEHQRTLTCGVHFLCSTLGVCIAIANNEIEWQSRKEGNTQASGLSEGLKGAVVALTLIGLLVLYKYYDSRLALKRLSGIRLAPGVNYASLAGAGLINACMWDILLMLPMPLPGINVEVTVWNKGLGRNTVYNSDTLLCVLCMFARVTFLPRFYGECISDLGSCSGNVFARFNRIKLDETFTIKFVLANSLDCVTFIAALSVAMFSYAMMVFERAVSDATLGEFANCVWLVVITMTTVGYGDEYPSTILGRLISILASIAAVVMLAITVNLVITKLSLTRAESKVVEMMDKVSVRKQMKQCAAIAIQRFVRAYFEFQHGRARHTNNSAQGYMVIPDMQSTKRKNQDLIQFVWSNVGLLEALNNFVEAKRSNTIAHLRTDLCEIAGSLQSTTYDNQWSSAFMKQGPRHVRNVRRRARALRYEAVAYVI